MEYCGVSISIVKASTSLKKRKVSAILKDGIIGLRYKALYILIVLCKSNLMASITKAKTADFQLLAEIGKRTFIESHGHSAAPEDINRYVHEKYNYDVCREELTDPKNIYHFIYQNNQPAGYSKIILHAEHPNIYTKNVTKLERLYLIKDFYSLKLGHELIRFNIELSQKNNQQGMWLFVWKDNHRAVNFYLKTGFKIIGSYDFRLTETHSNPNHQMFLEY